MALRRASSCFFNKLKLNLNPNLNNVAHRNLSTETKAKIIGALARERSEREIEGEV